MKRTKLLTCLMIVLSLTILLSGCKHPLSTATQGILCNLFFNDPGPGDLNIIKIAGGVLADDDQTILEEITISSCAILRHQITLNGAPKWEVITFRVESEKPLNIVTIDIKMDHPELFSNVKNGNLFPSFSACINYSASSGNMHVRFVSCDNDPVEFPFTTPPKLAPVLTKTDTWFVKLPSGKILTNNPQPTKKVLPATWGKIKSN